MLTIKGLATMRKLLNISVDDVAEEMNTNKETVNVIELDMEENQMVARFYRLTILKLVDDLDIEKREDLSYDLKAVIKYLETGKDEI